MACPPNWWACVWDQYLGIPMLLWDLSCWLTIWTLKDCVVWVKIKEQDAKCSFESVLISVLFPQSLRHFWIISQLNVRIYVFSDHKSFVMYLLPWVSVSIMTQVIAQTRKYISINVASTSMGRELAVGVYNVISCISLHHVWVIVLYLYLCAVIGCSCLCVCACGELTLSSEVSLDHPPLYSLRQVLSIETRTCPGI